MYNELIGQHGLYASFVCSEAWNSQLEAIGAVSSDAADAIGKYGIGTKVAEDGQYDFESGQLIADMPKNIRDSKEIEETYDAICDLAKAYAQFVCSYDV